jgi:hypothetical protein
MKPNTPMKKFLSIVLLAALAAGSSNLLASPDDDERGSGGGSSGSADALTSDFIAIPPTKGKGDGHYFPFSGGESIALNADVRLALEIVDEDGNTLKVLNTHLGITRDNYQDAVITVFIGTDEDGDGSCLTEGPTSICVLGGSGGHDLEVNDDGILHAAWAMALREDDGRLRGSGTCYSDFDSTEVVPQFDENGNMTSVVFNIVGGEEGMPEINEDDGTMVGFGAPWLGFTSLDCGSDASCEAIPIMMGEWDD